MEKLLVTLLAGFLVSIGKPNDPVLVLLPHVSIFLPQVGLSEVDLLLVELHAEVAEIVLHGLRRCLDLFQALAEAGHGHCPSGIESFGQTWCASSCEGLLDSSLLS